MSLSELSQEFNQCNKCGLCLAACPVCKELLLEKFSPRGKIQLARYYSQGALDLTESYRDIFSECLLCGACSVTCPSGVDLKKVFSGMRREIARKRGVHPKMRAAVASILEKHNISDEDNEDRCEWLELLRSRPRHIRVNGKAEVVYFVGCVASFFPMVQGIPGNMVRIMDAAGVDFAVLSGEEWCCGFPLIGAGLPEKMKGSVEHNLEKVRALGARTVVFSCPSCLRTWREHYDTDLELVHSVEFLERLIHEGALSLGELDMTITYHDPCDLGRNGGVFEPPRRVLRAIPGLRLVELENNRAKSVCCGGGGNLEMADAELSGAVAGRKIEEILDTGAECVATACQQCVRTIQTSARRKRIGLRVMDITELVVRALAD